MINSTGVRLATFLQLAIAVLVQVDHSSCFWFADSSLFQAPDQAQPATTTTAAQTFTQIAPQADNQKQQQQQRLSQECHCFNASGEWLQNQTGAALARWLGSAQAASQLRLLVSNSTGASSGGRQQRGNWAANASRSSSAAASAPSKPSGWPRPAAPRHSRHGQQQPPVKLVQGERGPPGPKGDTGERGARGESGLRAVRDLAELFGEQQAGSQPKATDGGADELLAFVEAEQVLVVRTSSGWRPLQLLRPLRDPRLGPRKPTRVASGGVAFDFGGLSVGIDDDADDDADANDLEEADDADDLNADNNVGRKVGTSSAAADEEEELDEDEDEDDEEEDEDGDVDVDEDAIREVQRRAERGKASGKRRAGRNENELAPLVVGRRRLEGLSSSAGPAPPAARVSGRSAMAQPPPPPPPQSQQQPQHQRQQPKQKPSQTSINHQADHSSKQPKLRLAALNEPFSGNIHGVRGADFECKRHAAKARLKGSFRALLATSFQSLNELVRLNTHEYPIVNLHAEPLASSWNELFRQQAPPAVASPLSRVYSFDGRHVATDSHWPNKLVWHGAANKLGYRDLANNCDSWHSDSLNKFGAASPLHNPRNHPEAATQQHQQQRRRLKKSANQQLAARNASTGAFFEHIERYPCRMPLIVLCIETIGQPIAPAAVATSRQSLYENSWDAEINNNSL